MFQSLQDCVRVGFRGWMTLRPVQRTPQIIARIRPVQPEFVFRNDQGGTDQPHAGFPFLDENLASREFLSQRNLTIRADDFDARPGSGSSHFYARIDYWSLHAI